MPTGREGRRAVLAGWLGTMGAISGMSVFGRELQGAFVQGLGGAAVPWTVGLLTVIVALAGGAWLLERAGPRALWGSGVLVFAACVLPLGLAIPEERLHVALFALFGFLTLRLFEVGPGLAVCAAMAGLDEVLQGFLPLRVADWRDVAVNLVSALGGATVAFWGTLATKVTDSAEST